MHDTATTLQQQTTATALAAGASPRTFHASVVGAPPSVSATAIAPTRGRLGRIAGLLAAFALTPRAIALLAAGVLLAIPAFFVHHVLWLMPAWDAIVLTLVLWDATRLPAPDALQVERRFRSALSLGRPSSAIVQVTQSSSRRLRIGVQDSLHPALALIPVVRFVTAFPRDPVTVNLPTTPARRGDLLLDGVYLRCRALVGLAERRAFAPLEQTVRVAPAGLATEEASLALLRARQVELERRRMRRTGIGREFEALRDYQAGDEVRNLSWTATARRGRPITRTFSMERSQQVWVVVDAGRLSRTSFDLDLQRRQPDSPAFTESVHDDRIHVQQLDQAASTALLLTQVVDRAGDRSGLLVYGREVQQQIKPGKGALHLRRLVDALSIVTSERAEADHRRAAARLRQLQGRRSLVFWITEMGESATTPEVALAVADLTRQHLVVLVLLEHPELSAHARLNPHSAEEMFSATAAGEMLARRDSVVRQLQARGVLVLETSPAHAPVAAIDQYLEIKSRGAL